MAGFPVALEAQVVDDCGSPLNSGSVLAYFSGGDAPASLTAVGNGHWAASWAPRNLAGGATTVGILASSLTGLFGSAGVMGTLTANTNVPAINVGGAVSAASLGTGLTISPGEFLSIFGSNLGVGTTFANSLPLPATLASTEVSLAGERLPLQVTTSGQINAIVPYDSPVNTSQPLIVQRNGIYSLPEPVLITEAHPGVFTQDQSGKGAGVIIVVKPDGTQFLNTPTKPASADDALVIYCTGLGAVKPTIAAGSAAPSSPPAKTVNPVTVSIGGVPATVLFAGLSPGFAGLYQVNVRVPPGITPGPSIPVIVSEAGQSGAPVTVAIH